MASTSMEAIKAAEIASALEQASAEIVSGIHIESTGGGDREALQGGPPGRALPEGILVLSEDPAARVDVVIVQHVESGIVQLGFADDFLAPEGFTMPAARVSVDGRTLHPLGVFPVAGGGGTEALHASSGAGWNLLGALRIPTGVAQHIAHFVDSRNKPNPGWIAMADGYAGEVNGPRVQNAKGTRVLLFVHGIFSSVSGAFSKLGLPGSGGTLDTLLERYDNNVFGYDHWTIAKTPLENAIDLLEALPDDAAWDVDLVCHSRGGLVTRALFVDPATASTPDLPQLDRIAELRKGRIANLRKVIFVAGANQGSPLASPERIRNFLKVAAVLASKTPGFTMDVVIGLVRAVLSAAYDLPSIRQLDGETSALIARLNRTPSLMDAPPVQVFGVRANFDPRGWTWTQAAAAVEAYLMPEPNDLVVPYGGVTVNPAIPDGRQLNFDADASQSLVWHTHYFEQCQTQAFLRTHLEGEASPPLP